MITLQLTKEQFFDIYASVRFTEKCIVGVEVKKRLHDLFDYLMDFAEKNSSLLNES
jgi:hypothetical protein